jgi:hypothetical protein
LAASFSALARPPPPKPALPAATDCPKDSAARISAPLAMWASASFWRLGGRGLGSRLGGRGRGLAAPRSRAFCPSGSFPPAAAAAAAAAMSACTAAAARLATPEPTNAARSGDGPRGFSFSAAAAVAPSPAEATAARLGAAAGQSGAAAGLLATLAAGQSGAAALRDVLLSELETSSSPPPPLLLGWALVKTCAEKTGRAGAARSPVPAEFASCCAARASRSACSAASSAWACAA